MAASLSVSSDDFSLAWIDGGEARTLGTVDSPMGSLVEVCRNLGIRPAPEQLQRACTASTYFNY